MEGGALPILNPSNKNKDEALICSAHLHAFLCTPNK